MYPKIIHQTYKTKEIPKNWEKSKMMWETLHPDYEYRFWTDADILIFIQKYYPNFLEIYNNFKYNIQRVDMMRYFILYHYGGIYCDLDIYPSKNISKYIEIYNKDVLLVKSGNINCFTNSFMISKQYAPFWLKVHKNLNSKLPFFAVGKHMEVMYSTGPLFISKIIDNQDSIQILPSELFMAYSSSDNINEIKDSAILHPLEGKSWNGIDSHLFNFINKEKNRLPFIFAKFKNMKNLKNILDCSVIDKISTGDNNYITFECINISNEYINNLSKIDYADILIRDNYAKITFDHNVCDAYKLIVEMTGTNVTYDYNDNLLYLVSPVKVIPSLYDFTLNSAMSKSFSNKKYTENIYKDVRISINLLKKKMTELECNHMSSFLFALQAYGFYKMTNATFIKCKIIYYIPWIKGNNKFFPNHFIIDLEKNNSFKYIYQEIVNNKKTVLEMWGYHSWFNMYKVIEDKNVVNVDTEENKNWVDIVFSNIPQSYDLDSIKIIEKTQINEKMYCFCIGNRNQEIAFSWVLNGDDIENIDKILSEFLL